MLYKSILNVVGVVAVAAAVMLTECGGNSGAGPNNPDNPDIGGGKGSDISNYKTVMIGTQKWMAENLDNAIAGSVCYDNNSSNCATYGRLYTWDAANRACPSGWHLPSDAEWNILVENAGGLSMAGGKLKSASGWYDNGNGTDDFGFSALPGGDGNGYGHFDNTAGFRGRWWSATTATKDSMSMGLTMSDNDTCVVWNGYFWPRQFSVRCVQDN